MRISQPEIPTAAADGLGEAGFELIEAFETDEIDLVLLNTAPLPLQARVLKDKDILVDRNPHFRHAFESLAIRKNLDFSIREEAMLRRRFNLGG